MDVRYSAQPGMQQDVLRCSADIILVGGSRGSGKTLVCLAGDWVLHMEIMGKHARGLVVRKKAAHLKKTVEEAEEYWRPLIQSKRISQNSAEFTFKNGAKLWFSYLETEADASQYAGWNLTWILVEEANLISSWTAIMRLRATLRSGKRGERRMLMTCNPEGPGLLWLKDMFITPTPDPKVGRHLMTWQFRDGDEPLVICFIPGLLEKDNPTLLANDPKYMTGLIASTSGDPALYKAWIEGDWNAYEGQFFSNWNAWVAAGGVIEPFYIPSHWPRIRAGDWGSSAPFAFGWFAEATEQVRIHGVCIPAGSLVLYREWYGVQRDPLSGRALPNKGLKIQARDVGAELARKGAADPRPLHSVLDRACFADGGTVDIARHLYLGERDATREVGLPDPAYWIKSNSKRVSEQGHMGGWEEVRRRMWGIDVHRRGRRPLLYVFSTCRDLIRTMPNMVHDEKRPEDMKDSKQGAEDHDVDMLRYACMSRPWGFVPAHQPSRRSPYLLGSDLNRWRDEMPNRPGGHRSGL